MSTTREIIKERCEAQRQVHLRYALKQATLALLAAKSAGYGDAADLLRLAIAKLRSAKEDY